MILVALNLLLFVILMSTLCNIEWLFLELLEIKARFF